MPLNLYLCESCACSTRLAFVLKGMLGADYICCDVGACYPQLMGGGGYFFGCIIVSDMAFGKRKKENAQLREALGKAMEDKQQAESRTRQVEQDSAEQVAQVTQEAEERVQESEAQFQRDAASIREERDRQVSDAEGRAEREREQKFDAHLVPGTPLILFEQPDNPEDLARAEQAIDSLTEWQVEHIIEAEATVRRDLARAGAEYRKAMLAGKSDDELAILKSRLDALIDELSTIRKRAEQYEQGILDEYSAVDTAVRLWEGMKDRAADGSRLTKKEVSFLYKEFRDLKDVLRDDVYRDIAFVWDERRRENQKEDYAVLYDCDEDQIVLRDDMDEVSQEKIFSGAIVYCDSSLTLKHATAPSGFIHNEVKFPLTVHGQVWAQDLSFFDAGVVFPVRVEENFIARDVVSENITSFPKYIEGNCHVGINDYSPTKGFHFSEYVGGSFTMHPTDPVEQNTFPRHVGGDFELYGKITSFRDNTLPEYIGGDCNLYGLTSAEHFECPQHIGGKLILSHKLKNDRHLDIPEGVEVYWV